MNLSLIINVIIVIFIFHLIIINLDYNYSFNLNEFYTPPTLSQTYISPQDELRDFLNLNNTLPSNYFPSNDNSSNFSSNINPIDQYYSLNNESVKSVETNEQSSNIIYSNYLNNQSENNCSTNIKDLRNGMSN